MRINNASGLPEGLVRAIANDPYTSEGADITASTLSDPPLLQALKRKYEDQLEEDAADRIWALFGQAVHVIVDRSAKDVPNVLSEQRLFMDVGGWKVSGAFDHLALDSGVLSDWKCTSAWTLVFGDRLEDWTRQLNTLAHLIEANRPDYRIGGLEVVAILRDWSQRDVDRSLKGDYPKAPVVVVPLKLWPKEKRQSYIEERVALHRIARELVEDRPELITPCTDEERWMKKDRKGVKTYARCSKYCPVNKFCPVLAREGADASQA